MTFVDWLLYILKTIADFIVGLIATAAIVAGPFALLWALLYLLLVKVFLLATWVPLIITAVVVVLVFILILILDKGVAWVTAGCALNKYRFKPDACAATTCKFSCVPIKGPYPKLLGSYAIFKQDIGCICPASPLAGFGPFVQTLVNSALSSKEISELMRAVEALMRNGIENEDLTTLYGILEKRKKGIPLTDSERDELNRILDSLGLPH